MLGLPRNEVTVQCLRMGGGFGGKEMQPHGCAAIAALGAVLTGRPVRLRLNRTQDMTMTGKRHPFHAAWEVGFDDDGRIRALRATLTATAAGASTCPSRCWPGRCATSTTPTGSPTSRSHGRIAKTNKTSQTAFRGFGGPQGMIVIEDILGRCAPLLGIDPEELRRRNFYQPGQRTPYGQPVQARRPARRRSGTSCSRRGGSRSGRREIAAFNADAPAHQAGAGDDAGEVRHLVQLHARSTRPARSCTSTRTARC